ncbi:MAG: hypothetical protein V4474_00830 [Patescibacteria group bacterium]
MSDYAGTDLLFFTEPKVTKYPFPIEVPALAGKFMVQGLAIAPKEHYPYYFYLYPSGIWRDVAQTENQTAYYDTEASAKRSLLQARISRHPEWERDADESKIIMSYRD